RVVINITSCEPAGKRTRLCSAAFDMTRLDAKGMTGLLTTINSLALLDFKCHAGLSCRWKTSPFAETLARLDVTQFPLTTERCRQTFHSLYRRLPATTSTGSSSS